MHYKNYQNINNKTYIFIIKRSYIQDIVSLHASRTMDSRSINCTNNIVKYVNYKVSKIKNKIHIFIKNDSNTLSKEIGVMFIHLNIRVNLML